MTITRGRTSIFSSTLLFNGAAVAPGVSDDLRFAVKWNPTDDDSKLVFTCAIGDGVVFSGGTGQYTLTISAAKSSLLPAARERLVLSFELLYVKPPKVYTLDSGILYVEPSVLQNV